MPRVWPPERILILDNPTVSRSAALAEEILAFLSAQPGLAPDLVLVNGEVLTMDDKLSRAQALAIIDGRKLEQMSCECYRTSTNLLQSVTREESVKLKA